MGTLYVVGVPAGNLEHLTQRARRILGEAGQIVAEDVESARALLAHLGTRAPLSGVSTDGADVGLLQQGDVALVVSGWPGEAGRRLVWAAAQQGHEVASVPGPALPITALVLSGLPADAFVYLGELPLNLPASLAGEQRTLVALASPPLPDVLAGLYGALGDRPLAVVPASGREGAGVWRGSLADAVDEERRWPREGQCALVIGGAQEETRRWDEQQVAAEIEVQLGRGRRAKEISRQLTEASGWSRREIYDLVVEIKRVSSQ